MEYVYAAMLLHKAEKPIDEKNLTEVLKAAGIKADPVRIKALVASLSEVDIDKAIKASTIMPVTPAPTAAPTAPTPETKSAEGKKEKEEEKEKEEAALEGLGALFG
jgi:large subunit ribosomal protein L12